MTRVDRERLFYTSTLSAAAFSLPLSVWLLSLFTILLAISWFISRGWERINLLRTEKSHILVFLTIYLVYLAWMINTSDIRSGLAELRLKLPLVVFPLVTGLLPAPGKTELRRILVSFIAGVVLTSLYGVLTAAHEVYYEHADPRSLSPFISHIRLSVMAVFSIFISLYYVLFNREKGIWKIFFIISAVWLSVYLFLLLSFTGLVVFTAAFVISGFTLLYRTGKRKLIAGWIIFLTGIAVFLFLFINSEIRSFSGSKNNYPEKEAALTLNGNPYFSDSSRHDLENGNRVWSFICEKELRKGWNSISRFDYESTDMAGQEIRYTIIRYMTSAGLKKDSAGLAALSHADITNIEGGMTNRSFSSWGPFKRKLYETVWQIDYYRNGGNPSGHSLTQRFEFLKTGWHIFLSYPLSGVGTGDLNSAYSVQYEKDKSLIGTSYRLLCHNQFLTFLVSFGFAGFLIVCFAIFYPFIRKRLWRSYLPTLFFGIVVLSMLWEDTLETHTGITFFTVFYSLFILNDVDASQENEPVELTKND